MMADLIPELNRVDIQTPTEDGKLSFVMNTMVPRKLEQFDDIKTDLANPGFRQEKAYFYVNFQAGDFCGRSYKMPISELKSFMKEALINKENFDENFFIDENGVVNLIVDSEGSSLLNKINALELADADLDDRLNKEADWRQRFDEELDLKKQDKIVIYGNGDYITSEGLPASKQGANGFGVHVTYGDETDPGVPREIKISHDMVVPAGGWVSKYNVGGIAVGQGFPEGTKITEVWRQLLEGDPRTDNVFCGAVSATLPQYWTDIPWRQFTVSRAELLAKAFDDWTPVIANREYIMCAIPLAMIEQEGPTAPEKKVKLYQVYNVANPEYTYAFNYYDIKNSSASEQNGYRVYYIKNQVTGTFNDLVWEFKVNE